MQRRLFSYVLSLAAALTLTAACTVVFLGLVCALQGETPSGEPVAAASATALTVVVDAGHGGMDGGAVGTDTGVAEAGLNLAVASLLKEALEAEGMAVVMTRESGEALADTKRGDMEARRRILRRPDVDLVVSIHMNKFTDRSVSGAMAYFMQGSAEGEALAQAVIDSVCDAIGQKRRAANPGDYFIVRECAAPAVLVECGFLSNAGDERRLQDAAHQRTLAQAICTGILSYMEGKS